MTGKFWSPAEEKYFWKTVVAHSVKRAPVDLSNNEKTWEELAVDMQKAMEHQGTARRWYTGSVLFEHYFQNVEGDRRSPNATAYVVDYMKKLGPFRRIINPRSGPRGGRPRRRGVAMAEPQEIQAPPPSPDGFTVTPLEEDDVFSPEYAARQALQSRQSRQSSQSSQSQESRCSSRLPKRRRLQPLAPAPHPPSVQEPSFDIVSNNLHQPTWSYQMDRQSVKEESVPESSSSRFDALLAAAQLMDTADYSTGGNSAQDHFTMQPSYPSLSFQPQDISGYRMENQTADNMSSSEFAYSGIATQGFIQNTSSITPAFQEECTLGNWAGRPSIPRLSSTSSLSTICGPSAHEYIPTGETTEEELSTEDEGENKENEGGTNHEDIEMPGFRLTRGNPIQQDFIIYEDGRIVQGLQLHRVHQVYGNFDTYDANKENEGIQGAYDASSFGLAGGAGGVPSGVFDTTEGLYSGFIPSFPNW
ncbi:putative copper homeostasis protein cutc protein [Daldinia childiae]|uniref:putative copper homeostasis protein cutc protein n=1 Tax=Daldinia childiae TaxID=326645 RepID=UPI0014486C6D|nr:putative copper homeostasis protein cutc protein [Daldinia childiae]KAF3063618.1 putative copper homeostasis protein cutc protein [Daldinia childiae]